MKSVITNTEDKLLNDLSQLIEQSQRQVVAQANSTLTLLFWQVGNLINQKYPPKQASGVCQTNCVDGVYTIESEIWK